MRTSLLMIAMTSTFILSAQQQSQRNVSNVNRNNVQQLSNLNYNQSTNVYIYNSNNNTGYVLDNNSVRNNGNFRVEPQRTSVDRSRERVDVKPVHQSNPDSRRIDANINITNDNNDAPKDDNVNPPYINGVSNEPVIIQKEEIITQVAQVSTQEIIKEKKEEKILKMDNPKLNVEFPKVEVNNKSIHIKPQNNKLEKDHSESSKSETSVEIKMHNKYKQHVIKTSIQKKILKKKVFVPIRRWVKRNLPSSKKKFKVSVKCYKF